MKSDPPPPVVPSFPASLTPAAVAARLGVGVGKVTGWIRRGQLRAIDVASEPGPGKRRSWRITFDDLAAFERQRATGHLPEPASVVVPKSRKPTRNVEKFV